jgi:hypothetical protein
MHFQPISLKSQQSLAIQSHGLSTWTTIVWSGPDSRKATFTQIMVAVTIFYTFDRQSVEWLSTTLVLSRSLTHSKLRMWIF